MTLQSELYVLDVSNYLKNVKKAVKIKNVIKNDFNKKNN